MEIKINAVAMPAIGAVSCLNVIARNSVGQDLYGHNSKQERISVKFIDMLDGEQI